MGEKNRTDALLSFYLIMVSYLDMYSHLVIRACGNDSDGGRLNFFLSFLDHYPFITVTVTGGINP